MSSTPKLSKKQKKSLAFRSRKGKAKNSGALDVPENDLLDENVQAEEELNVGNEEATAPLMQKDVNGPGPNDGLLKATKDRKRKREGEAVVAPAEPVKEPELKKRKKEVKSGDDGKEDEEADVEGTQETHIVKKQRFILFVGNLKYTTTTDAILKHFSACDPPPTVRLLTPKPSATPKGKSKPATKSKGCAFLEFSHRNALQQGLKLHHTDLDGRKINVELTAGGGGKSEARLTKVKQRNMGLNEQRVKKKEKTADVSAIDQKVDLDTAPNRHSSTSGVEKVHAQKRTWSVPEGENQNSGTTAVKNRKKRGLPKRSKMWGTGVNAIPVG